MPEGRKLRAKRLNFSCEISSWLLNFKISVAHQNVKENRYRKKDDIFAAKNTLAHKNCVYSQGHT